MSRKIYNEVVSKFNDKTQKWETIYEDSYDYDGHIDELAPKKPGVGAFEDITDIDTLKDARNLTSEIERDVRKMQDGWDDVSKSTLSFYKNMEQTLISSEALQKAGAITAQGYKDIAKTAFDIKSGTMDAVQAQIRSAEITSYIADNAEKITHEQLQQLMIQKGLLDNYEDFLMAEKEIETRSEAHNKLLQSADDLTGGMASNIKEFFDGMNAGGMVAFASILAIVVGLTMKLADHANMVGESFGASGNTGMRAELMGTAAEAQRLGYDLQVGIDNAKTLTSQFGVGLNAMKDLSDASLRSARSIGVSTETAAVLVGMFTQLSGHSAKSAELFMKQNALLAYQNNVAPNAVFEQIAESSENVALWTKEGAQNIFDGAMAATKMGINYDSVANAARGLLNVQESVQAEIEASVLTGKQMNLQRARELALAGKHSDMLEEIKNQVADESEWNAMNVFQREAMANAVNMTVQELSQLIQEEKNANKETKKLSELTLEDFASEEAIANITLFMSNLAQLGTMMLEGIANFTAFFESFGKGFGLWATAGVIVGAILLAIVAYLGFIVIQSYLAAWGMGLAGVAAAEAAAGFAALGATGPVAIPVLGAAAGVGWSIAASFAAIAIAIIAIVAGLVFLIWMLPSIANMDVVMGVIGLAIGFYMLAGALQVLAIAGAAALPVLGAVAAVAGIAAIGGFAALAVGGQKQNPVKEEIKKLNNKVDYLMTHGIMIAGSVPGKVLKTKGKTTISTTE